MLNWFSTRASVGFGRELAKELLAVITSHAGAREAKFSGKVGKALVRADSKVRAFRQREPMNFYKKSRLANAFLWELREGGCPHDYANELTDWLTPRL